MNTQKYKVLRTLYEDEQVNIVEIKSTTSDEVWALKTWQSGDLNAVRKEVDILDRFDSALVEQYSEIYEEPPSILFPYDQGQVLKSFIKENILVPEEKMRIALQLIEIIGLLEQAGVRHLQINPHHLRWNRQTQKLTLLHFHAAEAVDQLMVLDCNETPRNHWSYMAPEQTGLLFAPVDYRTDYYGVGATLFELFTRKPPFEEHVSFQHLHQLLNRSPELSHFQKSMISHKLLAILLKLMEKRPSDRYQKQDAIRYDLMHLSEVDEDIACMDQQEIFRVPEDFYGRESQLHQLENQFALTAMGAMERALVSGQVGSGKTTFIQQLTPYVIQHRGFLLRCELHEDKAGIELIDELLKQYQDNLARIGPKALSAFHYRLSEVFSNHLSEVKRMFPSLRLEPRVSFQVQKQDASKMSLWFKWLLKSMCSTEYPILLVIEDLTPLAKKFEWLFTILMERETYHHLMVVVSSNEAKTFDDFGLTRRGFKHYEMMSLTEADYHQMFMAAHLNADTVKSILENLDTPGKRTPYYIKELLTVLHHDGRIEYEKSTCDFHIAEQYLSDYCCEEDIGQVIDRSIRRLTADQILLLLRAAAVGHAFSVTRLQVIYSIKIDQCLQMLEQLAHKGFIMARKNGWYQFVHPEIVRVLRMQSDFPKEEDTYKQWHSQNGFKIKNRPEALEGDKMEETLDRPLAHMANMTAEVMARLIEISNLEAFYTALAEVVNELTGAGRSVIVSLDPDGQVNVAEWQNQAVQFRTYDHIRECSSFPEKLLHYVLDTHQTLKKDVLDQDRFINKEYLQVYNVNAYLAVPIVENNHAIGALYVEYYMPQADLDKSMLNLQLLMPMIAPVKTHIKQHEEMREQLDEQALIIDTKNNELLSLNYQLHQVIMTDELTGLFNKKKLRQQLMEEIARFKRFKEPFCIILMDLDDFKAINTHYGYHRGDEVLKEVGQILLENLRTIDIFGRWLSDQFLILCTQTELKRGIIVAEKLHDRINHYVFKEIDHLTASFGVSAFDNTMTANQLIGSVEGLVQQAKDHGKNKVQS